MKKVVLKSYSPQETKKIANVLVKTFLAQKKFAPPHIFALSGNLGVGKTNFVQGVAKALKIKQPILSPTFVIIKDFKINKRCFFKKLYHIDCYRLEKISEIKNLGINDVFSNPTNLIFIEWPEKIKKIIPRETVWIKFKIINKNIREITFNF
ncbi:MAG: tRNA (adenosine(37)-N6)-threonylcarbamoyltransferase complex ATPase subunit type 1 TsaE [Patescibacteria group bacterium]|jgi:tRNA threonylcarbamoyladenosine biosynthesis protein TsaE|nr:tRNA (adenosine(37)-N6)-threonylcarbamoyltransferase complex ATPase subunit type 1 TsaE [Patescibacteria group bacterium]